MNNFYAILLAFLELNFVFIGLSLLHSQRRRIGTAPFYLSIGMVFLFAQMVSAAGLEMRLPLGGDSWEMPLGLGVLFTPYLAVLLLVYVTEGALAMQRLVVGAVVVLAVFLYLGELTAMQCGWTGYSSTLGLSSEALRMLLTGSRRSMMAMVLMQAVDMFILPVAFTWLRKRGCRTFVSFLGTLLVTQLVDTVIYQMMVNADMPQWWGQLNATFIVRGISAVWVSLLLTAYVLKVEGSGEMRVLPSSSFELVFAFFGGYGRSKALEKTLLESEWRYRKVIASASEMVMLLDRSGKVIEANLAAAQVLGTTEEELIKVSALGAVEALTEEDVAPLREALACQQTVRCRVRLKASVVKRRRLPRQVVLSLTISPFQYRGVPMLIVMGRDITDEVELAKERERLSEQLAHSQRIEAIGQLAGGVAHDFNNHIHAILGNIDLANMSSEAIPDDVQRHLDKIAMIAEQAGKLTQELLGFARRGKYREKQADLREIIENSVEMFAPNCNDRLELHVDVPDRPMMVKGDMVQLQQVLINLLINARDAVEDKADGRIGIVAGEAAECPGGFHPEQAGIAGVEPEDYWYMAVEDNGSGMSAEVIRHIFEPFYTTKPVGKGTGMGLAMAYGTISHHKGWLQLASAEDEGTIFFIMLPKSLPET